MNIIIIGNIPSSFSYWYNKKWVSIGDSNTSRRLYQAYVVQRLGLQWVNYAAGGTDASYWADDEKLAKIVVEKPDVVTIMLGINTGVNDGELPTNNISIDAVCISEGPGSYTGLRIGCSTAKGLCYALKCKLLSISTLKLIARITKEKYNITHGYICPCIDARRMEVYTSLYNNNLDEILPATATILNDEFLIQYSLKDIIYICGNGAEKCNKLNLNNNYNIITDIIPTADKMLMLATEEYNKSHFEDIAYYEPFYLKEFQATTPSNKLFNLINGK